MRTFLTVCSTLACAGSAFVAYEHPEWIRQTAQHWEAWRKSSATAPPATPIARAIDDAAGQVNLAATELRNRVDDVESLPVAGKPLDQWFSELSGLATAASSASVQSGPRQNGAVDELQNAARALAGRRSEPADASGDMSADPLVVERDLSLFRTPQKVSAGEALVARPASTSRGVPSVSLSSRTLGQGLLRTLVVAGLNGENQGAVAAAEELIAQLTRQPAVLENQTFLLIPRANPGGLQAARRFNDSNVDLNRNFPSRRYRPQVEFSGTCPASETETQQLLRLMFEFQPERVVHIVEDPLATRVLFNRAATELAGQLHQQHQIAIERLDFDRLPGSLEEFSDGTFHVPVLVIGLKPGESAGLLAALVSTTEPGEQNSPEFPAEPDRAEPPAAPVGPVAGPRSSTPAVPASGRGYEELPPPPQ